MKVIVGILYLKRRVFFVAVKVMIIADNRVYGRNESVFVRVEKVYHDTAFLLHVFKRIYLETLIERSSLPLISYTLS